MANIEITIEQENDLTIFTVEGELTANEIIKYSSKFYDKKPTKKILWDATKGSVSKITSGEFRKIAKEMKKFTKKREGGKTALVGSFDADFGLARMYEVYAESEELPVSYGIFRDIDEAKEWLNL